MTRFLGIDYGTKRVGLAISDGIAMTANPLEVVSREEAVSRIRSIVGCHDDIEMLVMGLPTGLRGQEGSSVDRAREFAAEVEEATGLDIAWVDERFTSRLAEGVMLQAGVRRRERRAAVDKVAAAIILQEYLDRRSAGGN